jgi:hypothetical protein
VKYGSKTLDATSGGMPVPVSRTQMTIPESEGRASKDIGSIQQNHPAPGR